VKLDSTFSEGYISITMAMSPHANDPLILSVEVVIKLICASNYVTVDAVGTATDIIDDADSDSSNDDNGQSNINDEVVDEENDASNIANRETPRSANAETVRK
jgi:hypothetical protein